MTNEDPTQIQIANLILANQQAAEYGLNLLQEKTLLENQCERLQIELEQLKNQLKISQKTKFDQLLKIEKTEDTLQIQENDFLQEILNYKQQIRFIQQNNQYLIDENENFQELINKNNHFEQLYLQLKSQLKEYEKHQEKLGDINNELIDENVYLQEQNEKFNQYCNDYDELRNENRQLHENIEEQSRIIEKFESLKIIADKQLIDLQNHLRDEREQKFLYKQQLQKESLRNLKMTLNENDVDEDEEEINFSEIIQIDPQPSNENLFNEIHQLTIINEKCQILFHKFRNLLSETKSFDKIDLNDTLNLLVISNQYLENFISKFKEQEVMINKLKQDSNLLLKTHEYLVGINEDFFDRHSHLSPQFFDLTTHENLLKTISEQIKQLKQAYLLPRTNLSNESKDYQDQIFKLHLLLTTKHEQIRNLRQLIKGSKQSAEFALANLKTKHENEKSILIETISKLREEISTLKEYSSLHSIYLSRCEQYSMELADVRRQIHAYQEEKQTLNSLLHLAIEQKLKLTQKFENLEIDHEQDNQRHQRRFIPPRMLRSLPANRNQPMNNH